MFDLVLRNGIVLDPAQGIKTQADVAFAAGKVAAVGQGLGPAAAERDATGLYVVPGLIDLHTHVYWGGTSLGVDPDAYAKQSGVTTVIDAGSAGPGNIAGFRKHVIEPAEVRIVPFLNISFAGIFGFSHHLMVGECDDLRLLHPRACVEAARDHADIVAGIKIRVGRGASGSSGLAPLDMGLETAAQLGLPVMAHLDHPPPYRSDVMARLRPGDIITHCFRPFPNTAATADGRIHQDVLDARARGVLFDIGHGAGSFGFATSITMLKNGFLPDVISSDVHTLSIGGPAYDLLHTMSKFLALGVTLPDVIRATTVNAAKAARIADRGTLKPGLLGDATVLAIEKGRIAFEDVIGDRFEGNEKLVCRGIVLNGRWWHG
jgi:dihydroorotase